MSFPMPFCAFSMRGVPASMSVILVTEDVTCAGKKYASSLPPCSIHKNTSPLNTRHFREPTEVLRNVVQDEFVVFPIDFVAKWNTIYKSAETFNVQSDGSLIADLNWCKTQQSHIIYPSEAHFVCTSEYSKDFIIRRAGLLRAAMKVIRVLPCQVRSRIRVTSSTATSSQIKLPCEQSFQRHQNIIWKIDARSKSSKKKNTSDNWINTPQAGKCVCGKRVSNVPKQQIPSPSVESVLRSRDATSSCCFFFKLTIEEWRWGLLQFKNAAEAIVHTGEEVFEGQDKNTQIFAAKATNTKKMFLWTVGQTAFSSQDFTTSQMRFQHSTDRNLMKLARKFSTAARQVVLFFRFSEGQSAQLSSSELLTALLFVSATLRDAEWEKRGLRC